VDPATLAGRARAADGFASRRRSRTPRTRPRTFLTICQKHLISR